MVESSSDEILADAETKDVAFLVVGDPFRYPPFSTHPLATTLCSRQASATTHTDLALRCRQHTPPIPTQTLPNASILTAVGATGLSLYNFGQTVSMVFFTDSYKPSSYYDRVRENATLGLHTLVLLDIKVKEPDFDAMIKGKRNAFLPPRFMTVAQCAGQMLESEEERKEGVCGKNRLAVGVARLGSAEQKIVSGTLEQLATADLGAPLHSLVLCGRRMHEMEWEYVREFAVDRSVFDGIWKRDYEGKG